ncbi:metal-sensitive transcriptional regulator [Tindallia californiensis]|uniref:DNA-binding transcriptional regulator, FrmR family n=1 Tax=Tindallia californiensis TaxID=159292 RepID=A0A1H3IXF4_9FIRM|nr:metal-sensitive transcriptional regulator [Tindallia californiensis]SDY32332.1 DNA-binding transcriptional regulator, FrmR family [Tindallia californiensis]
MEDTARKDLIKRLKTIRGHIQGVEKMIEENKECDAVMQQITAIKSSVEKVGWILIKDHAAECIVKNPSDREEVNRTIQKIAQFLK